MLQCLRRLSLQVCAKNSRVYTGLNQKYAVLMDFLRFAQRVHVIISMCQSLYGKCSRHFLDALLGRNGSKSSRTVVFMMPFRANVLKGDTVLRPSFTLFLFSSSIGPAPAFGCPWICLQLLCLHSCRGYSHNDASDCPLLVAFIQYAPLVFFMFPVCLHCSLC